MATPSSAAPSVSASRRTDRVEYGQPVTVYSKAKFFETASGNRVSRSSILCGSQHIRVTKGKSIIQSGAVLRGDLSPISVGKYSIVERDVVLRPPYKKHKSGIAFFPLAVGDYVLVEQDAVVEAVSIGNCVTIGTGSVIGKRCILKDGCVILPHTVLPPDTVVPSFTVFGGQPGVMVGQLPPSFLQLQKDAATTRYENFVREE